MHHRKKNMNVRSDDINTFKVWNTMGKFCQIFKMSNIWANRKALFSKVSVDFFILCSIPNKVHVKVTWTLKSNSKRLRWLSKYSSGTLTAFLEKLLLSLDPLKNSKKCFMKLKFRPYSRITFIFSWLKHEEILKTLESQVGWLLQKMALNSYENEANLGRPKHLHGKILGTEQK